MSAFFPIVVHHNPACGTSRSSRLANAPRVLNEPACCSSSSFSSSGPGASVPVRDVLLSGVLVSLALVASQSPTLAGQFAALAEVAVLLTMLIYVYCALSVMRFSAGLPPSQRHRVRAVGGLALLFCGWLSVSANTGSLWWAAALIGLAIAIGLATRRFAPTGAIAPVPAAEDYGSVDAAPWLTNALVWDQVPVDVSFLNHTPAGKFGRVVVRGEQFVFEQTGAPARFWSCNLAGQACFGPEDDTAGRALQNIDASLARGLRVFDAAVGGLGGCPYAPGAKGNVATEAVVAMLHNRGFETGIDVEALAEMSRFAQDLRRPL